MSNFTATHNSARMLTLHQESVDFDPQQPGVHVSATLLGYDVTINFKDIAHLHALVLAATGLAAKWQEEIDEKAAG